jgi:hypothetical protein
LLHLLVRSITICRRLVYARHGLEIAVANEGVWRWEDEPDPVTVGEPDEIRRSAAAAADLDDLGVSTRRAKGVTGNEEPVANMCTHRHRSLPSSVRAWFGQRPSQRRSALVIQGRMT